MTGTKLTRTTVVIEGRVLDDRTRLTLGELCRLCRLSAEDLFEMVDQGLLEPRGASPQEWSFPAYDVARIQAVRRLQTDLGVNLAGAALALDLVEELRRLRERLRRLDVG